MKQFWFQLFALMIIIFVALLMTFNQGVGQVLNLPGSVGNQNPTTSPNIKKIQIFTLQGSEKRVKSVVNIEIADTPQERAKGLGGRDSLGADSGMLFVFPQEDVYQFWMKGVKFPIDILWIKGNAIVDKIENVPPPNGNQPDESLIRYAPVVKVDKVLELPTGYATSKGIQVGDQIELLP